MMDADYGILNRFLGLFGVDPVWWLNADHSLWCRDHREHLARHPVQPGDPLLAACRTSPRTSTRRPRSTVPGAWRRFRSITFPLLRPVTAITLLLGFVYTLKVVDIIWIMTTGPGSSQTLATWAYGMAFGKGTSAVIKYSEASVVGHSPAGHRAGHGSRLPRRPARAGGPDMNRERRTWWKTAIGVVAHRRSCSSRCTG